MVKNASFIKWHWIFYYISKWSIIKYFFKFKKGIALPTWQVKILGFVETQKKLHLRVSIKLKLHFNTMTNEIKLFRPENNLTFHLSQSVNVSAWNFHIFSFGIWPFQANGKENFLALMTTFDVQFFAKYFIIDSQK